MQWECNDLFYHWYIYLFNDLCTLFKGCYLVWNVLIYDVMVISSGKSSRTLSMDSNELDSEAKKKVSSEPLDEECSGTNYKSNGTSQQSSLDEMFSPVSCLSISLKLTVFKFIQTSWYRISTIIYIKVHVVLLLH